MMTLINISTQIHLTLNYSVISNTIYYHRIIIFIMFISYEKLVNFTITFRTIINLIHIFFFYSLKYILSVYKIKTISNKGNRRSLYKNIWITWRRPTINKTSKFKKIIRQNTWLFEAYTLNLRGPLVRTVQRC